MPQNIIFCEESEVPKLQEIAWGEKKILCYPISSGKMCICRVISSNPVDFMNPDLQPGKILDITKIQMK